MKKVSFEQDPQGSDLSLYSLADRDRVSKVGLRYDISILDLKCYM